MSLVMNTNIGALNAQRSISSSSNELRTAMERLSSGKKINTAADDAAGFAIAERMTVQVRGLNVATKNANDGLSMLSVVDKATSDVTDMLQRMRELAIQAANSTNSDKDRQYIQGEAQSLIAEIDRVASQTQYNGQMLMDGSKQNIAIQVGTDNGQKVSLSISSLSSSNLGMANTTVLTSTNDTVRYVPSYNASTNTRFIEDNTWNSNGFRSLNVGDFVTFSSDTSRSYEFLYYATTRNGDYGQVRGNPTVSPGDTIFKVTGAAGPTISGVDLTTNPTNALATIDAAIKQVSGQRAEYGALQNRLEYTVSNLMNVSEFTIAARSRIEDADFAAESAKLAKAQVLQQSGAAMLSQANASSQLVVSLIR